MWVWTISGYTKGRTWELKTTYNACTSDGKPPSEPPEIYKAKKHRLLRRNHHKNKSSKAKKHAFKKELEKDDSEK